MLDDYVKELGEYFKKYGDPNKNPEEYIKKYGNYLMQYITIFYDAYKIDMLKQTVAISSVIPVIKVQYNGDLNATFNQIETSSQFRNYETIYITDEINDSSVLEKIKEKYPNKNIVVNWDTEFAFIDDVIDSIYMIDYYKSLVDEDLSPLEKITLAYDIIKSHVYKVDTTNTTSVINRNITRMVHNDYIVCRGYVNLLRKTLKDLGINSYPLHFIMDKNGNKINHVNLLIDITDPKYNLDNDFIFDPTLDSPVDLYMKFDNGIKLSAKKEEGFRRVDSLSKYNYFLIPFSLFEFKWKNTSNEELEVRGNIVDTNKMYPILHTNQLDSDRKVLPLYDFIHLISTVKQREGYSKELIPDLIQESLYLANYGMMDTADIKNAIDNNIRSNQARKEI